MGDDNHQTAGFKPAGIIYFTLAGGWLLGLMICGATLQLAAPAAAQSLNFAIVPASPEAGPVADVLTAELSQRNSLHLLERAEIDKVYQEQASAAVNRDDIKLGRLLGADGLLILEVIRTDQTTNLTARLVAVKPGVIASYDQFAWPLPDLTDWPVWFAKRLDPLLPKLAVSAGNAIPLSIVNLRSSMQTDEGRETEKTLKQLAIQRLSAEPQLFVLERERLQSLGEEKDLQSDQTPFWNGRCLLDATVDQNGYSRTTITITARLTPPKGGEPVEFEVIGARNNLPGVIDQLAAQVTKILRIGLTTNAWHPTDEAAAFVAEANWALKWGAFTEAQQAADAGWALGKHDEECATVRTKAYLQPLPMLLFAQNEGATSTRPGFHAVSIQETPDVRDCDNCLTGLKNYLEYSRLPGSDFNQSWYEMTDYALSQTTYVLRHFNYSSSHQALAPEKLSQLRQLAREVTDLIFQSPAANDYFTFDAGHPGHRDRIFGCILQNGCYWQEHPQDTISLYRKLLASPRLLTVHDRFWWPPRPLLVAWNPEDRSHLRAVWIDFVNELNTSANPLCRLEIKAIDCATAQYRAQHGLAPGDDARAAAAREAWDNARSNLLAFISTNLPAMYGEDEELLNSDLGLDDLLGGEDSMKLSTYKMGYRSQLKGHQHQTNYQKQVEYLKRQTPYEPDEFFAIQNGYFNYSTDQALQIKQLLVGYAAGFPTNNPTDLEARAERDIYSWQMTVAAQLHLPPPPFPRYTIKNHGTNNGTSPLHGRRPGLVSMTNTPPWPPPLPAGSSELTSSTSVDSNSPGNSMPSGPQILEVGRFIPVPLTDLPGHILSNSGVITAHHWQDGKVVVDFKYYESVHIQFSNAVQFAAGPYAGIAILDPSREAWQVIPCSNPTNAAINPYYSHTVLWHGSLFTSTEGLIKKYDLDAHQGTILAISDGTDYELFCVNDRLYAANSRTIFEIVGGGTSSSILASTRREPAVSVLDREDLGTPALFAGPGDTLRVAIPKGIYTWTGNDWRFDGPTPPASYEPMEFPDGLVFQTDGFDLPAEDSLLSFTSLSSAYNLLQMSPLRVIRDLKLPQASLTKWNLPAKLNLHATPVATLGTNLYLLANHSESQPLMDPNNNPIGEKFQPQDGYHAELLCFNPDNQDPESIPLRFSNDTGCPPVSGHYPGYEANPVDLSPAWFLVSSNFLFFGREHPAGSRTSQTAYPETQSPIGIWLLSADTFNAFIAPKVAAQQNQATQANDTKKEDWQTLLAKYDHNHNGILDPDEKEEALADVHFIELELDKIDANHNGLLDATELGFFDANTNNTLEPNEQAGVGIALDLLAQKLLSEFDANHDGVLDRQEFARMKQLSGVRPPDFEDFPQPPAPTTDVNGVAQFLKTQLTRQILSSRDRYNAFVRQPHPDFWGNPPTQFKAVVDFYWQYHAGTNN